MTVALAPAPTLAADQVALVRTWVNQYRAAGYQPLPSRLDEKRPMIKFGDLWETRVDTDLFAKFDYLCNVQVMTGSYWGLMVIDLDGPEAIKEWEKWRAIYDTPPTWEVISGSGGRHLWFSTPKGYGTLPSGRIWSIWDETANGGKGDWKKHTAIERLADRKLAVAPPSIHPKTGKRYKWAEDAKKWRRNWKRPVVANPNNQTRPTPAPDWLLRMPVLQPPKKIAATPVVATVPPRARERARHTSTEILAAISDKVSLARSWGLRFASEQENSAGWLSCHAAGREDSNPSASFSVLSGRYWAPETPRSGISLFELGVALNVYCDWRDARDHLAETYLGK